MQIDENKLKSLERIVEKYGDLFADVNAADDILNAYKLKKPLSSIEIYEKNKQQVSELTGELRKFFFADTYTDLWDNESSFSGLVFISRFSTLVKVAVHYHGLTDSFADLAGILYGIPANEIADYCLKLKERHLSTFFTKLFK